MPVFEWSPIYVLGVPEMDKTHEERSEERRVGKEC